MRTTLIPVLMLLLAAGSARSELAPDEVAVIAMAASPQSREVAEYYMQARAIPKANLLLLGGKPGESVSRKVWDEEMRPAIRKWLADSNLQSNIRCFVTCWDVPLKIGPRDPNLPAVVARKAYLAETRQKYVAKFADVLESLDSLGPGAKPADRPAYGADTPLEQLAKDYDAAVKSLQARVEAIESEVEKKQTVVAYEKLLEAAGGGTAVLALVAKLGTSAQAPSEALQRLEGAKGKLQGLQQGLAALLALPDSAARDVQVLALLQPIGGLLGAIRWIDEQQALLEKNETHASFDSELALVAWHDYPTFRWVQNISHYAFDALPDKWPTMMVSRLAAPKVEIVKKLIDTSIATEKSGLVGKVYLDARGMKGPADDSQRGGYGQYDQSLRDLAERLQKHTSLHVVLNNEEKVFQPGECPEAALYCGWYSLASYVDAFDWRPGAVGYHMASSEAARLREPGAKLWCSAMLEDGICATLGPVAEPYLAAFPLPDDFFPLLLTGRYTLVETYYRTLPFNSWQMVLVGDPLYNPFKAHPALRESDLPERMKPKR